MNKENFLFPMQRLEKIDLDLLNDQQKEIYQMSIDPKKAARKKAQICAKNRQREFKKAQRDRGLQQVTVWVPIEDAQKLRDTAKEMCGK